MLFNELRYGLFCGLYFAVGVSSWRWIPLWAAILLAIFLCVVDGIFRAVEEDLIRRDAYKEAELEIALDNIDENCKKKAFASTGIVTDAF